MKPETILPKAEELRDFNDFPFSATRMIEASAGTGKTYAICALALRWMLTQSASEDTSFPLIITFTRKATTELRERMEEVLRSAQKLLTSQQGKAPDGPIEEIVMQCSQQNPRLTLLRTHQCLTRMDELPIYTIDGFCNHLLQQSGDKVAWYSSRLQLADYFQQEAEEAAKAFWRSTASGDKTWLMLLDSLGISSPAILAKQLRSWQALGFVEDVYPAPPSWTQQQAADELATLQGIYASTAKLYETCKREYCQLVAQSVAFMPQNQWKSSDLLKILDHWLTQPSPGLSPAPNGTQDITRLTCDYLREKAKKANKTDIEELAQHPFTAKLGKTLQAEESLKPDLSGWILKQATLDTQGETIRRNEQRKQTTFTAVLQDALLTLERGGSKLAESIRARFPVVFIDEFQDTSNRQYELLSQIWGDAGTMVLVGDPKQVLYSFRGSDLSTYLSVRTRLENPDAEPEPAEQQASFYVLGDNYRSSDALVRAVNRLFGQAESLDNTHLPWHDCQAAMSSTHPGLSLDTTKAQPGIGLIQVDSTSMPPHAGIDAARLACARQCAGEVHALIHAGADQASIGERKVQAEDIAVIVPDNKRASLMQNVLAELGVYSARTSTESVVDTPQAQLMRIWMRAVANPANDRLMRTALAIPMMGISTALGQAVEEHRQHFWELHDIWRRHGWMATFYRLMAIYRIGMRYQRADRQRVLTNLRHLAETIDEETQMLSPDMACSAWEQSLPNPYDNLTSGGAQHNQERTLLLETDKKLVQVLTAHKAKGLEFPIVLLPFASFPQGTSRSDRIQARLADGRRVVIDANPDKEAAQKSREEEAQRALYVALTRASEHCRIYLLDLERYSLASSQMRNCALRNLLYPSDTEPPNCWKDFFESADCLSDASLIGFCPSLVDETDSDTTDLGIADCAQPTPLIPAQRIANHSYSSLTRTHLSEPEESGRETDEAAVPETELDDESAAEDESPIFGASQSPEPVDDAKASEAPDPIAEFEASAQAGLFFHELMERVPLGSEPATIAEEALKLRFGLTTPPQPPSQWHQLVGEWIATASSRFLPQSQCCLADLKPAQYLSEVRFDFSLQPDWAQRLRDSTHPIPNFSQLSADVLPGTMRGYIDLLFQAPDGRWWVADYKSNRLGWGSEAYADDPVLAAVKHHHYDWQAVFYALAAHRWLRSRLEGYDPDQHFGGSMVLFLRGMAYPDAPEGTGIWTLPLSGQTLQTLHEAFAGHD